METVTLYNVTDVRNGRHYSIAIVKTRLAKYFVQEDDRVVIE